jgi:hypothetical protein
VVFKWPLLPCPSVRKMRMRKKKKKKKTNGRGKDLRRKKLWLILLSNVLRDSRRGY